jgi:hypothetical protein
MLSKSRPGGCDRPAIVTAPRIGHLTHLGWSVPPGQRVVPLRDHPERAAEAIVRVGVNRERAPALAKRLSEVFASFHRQVVLA